MTRPILTLPGRTPAPPRPKIEDPPPPPTEADDGRARRRAAAKRARAAMIETLPALFDPKAPKPLAVGLGRGIIAHVRENSNGKIGTTATRRAIGRWTGRNDYLTTLAAEGAVRHDLDGQPVGPVRDEDRMAAVKAIAQRQEWRERRRHARTQERGDHVGDRPDDLAGDGQGHHAVDHVGGHRDQSTQPDAAA